MAPQGWWKGNPKLYKCHICPECLSATFPELPFHTSCQEISLTGCKWICAEHNRRPEEEMLSERVSDLPVSRSLWCRVKLNRRHETICSRSLGPSGLQILIVLNGYCRCDNYLSLFQSCADIATLIKAQPLINCSAWWLYTIEPPVLLHWSGLCSPPTQGALTHVLGHSVKNWAVSL